MAVEHDARASSQVPRFLPFLFINHCLIVSVFSMRSLAPSMGKMWQDRTGTSDADDVRLQAPSDGAGGMIFPLARQPQILWIGSMAHRTADKDGRARASIPLN